MAASLENANVVVIGGSSGIGLATASLASNAGANVTIVGRDETRLAAAVEALGANATGVRADVADEDAVRDLFSGFDRVDHVANFAGTHVNGPITDLPIDEMRVPVDNRLWGPVFVFRHAAPKMTTGGSITICTGAGVARPRIGGAMVSAACGGAEILAIGMANELAPIRVNVIRPGIVDTPLLERMAPGNKDAVIDFMTKRIPLKRAGQPEEIAEAVLFLMTNTYVTGTILTVDGGAGLV